MSDTNTATAAPSEALTPAELAYFNSGGTDTSGLEAEYGGLLSTPTPEPAVSADAPATDPDDELEDGDEATQGGEGERARDDKGRFVPHAALHKERTVRKATQTENAELKAKLATIQGRFDMLQELANRPDTAQPAANEKPAPKSALEEEDIDPEQDVFAAFRQLQRRNAELVKGLRDRDQRQSAVDAATTVKNTYQSDAEAFMKEAPDFKDAYQHLLGALHKELEFMGVGDRAERLKMIAAKERDFVSAAIEQKKRPAQMIYELAKIRGFQGPPPPQNGNSQQDKAKDSATAKLEAIKRSQSASLSLTRAGGASGEGLTLEAFVNMPEDEFAAVTKKMSKAQLRQLMGG